MVFTAALMKFLSFSGILCREEPNKYVYYYILPAEKFRCNNFVLKMETIMVTETAMLQSICTLRNGTRRVSVTCKDYYGACSNRCRGERYN